ncbi:hypothetical protein ACFL3C_05070 [Patescibacteria group bacterium]
MPAPNLKDKILKLPLPQKVIGIGAFLALASSFLPWYQDIDAFNTGDRFLGITGPLYLVGYIIIALSLFSIILTGFYALGRKLPPLPMKESIVYILSGAISLFLLVVANSVYFHPKFGINIMSKEYQIGMMLAFVGSLAITIGGVLQHRESGTSRFIKEFQEEAQEEEQLDPVLELNNFQKEQQIEHQKGDDLMRETIEHSRTPVVERKPSGVREYKAKPDVQEDNTKVRMEPYPDVNQLRKEREAQDGAQGFGDRSSRPMTQPKAETKDSVNPNTVIRMDL